MFSISSRHLLRHPNLLYKIAPEGSNQPLMQPSIPKKPAAIVGAIIFDAQGRVFLMRSSGKYGDEWIVPGGKIDFGEPMLIALKREIKEETNLDLDGIVFCGVRELIEPERHFVFLEFKATAKNPTEVKLNNEATEHAWLSYSQLSDVKIAAPTLAFLKDHWK